jgi:hypothetical protein
LGAIAGDGGEGRLEVGLVENDGVVVVGEEKAEI